MIFQCRKSCGTRVIALFYIIMLQFIIRRLFYSALILSGVVLLTFLLFNVAAGDPAAAVLGKNARPAEVEALRRELGADLPLFFGRECVTEAFPVYEADAPLRPGVTLRDGELLIARSFDLPELLLCVTTEADGRKWTHEVPPSVTELSRKAQDVKKVEFFRLQTSPWHSQFAKALGEIISFTPEFPFVKVLDFGRTITTREPIGTILKRGVAPSLCLMLPIFFGELVLGVILALAAAAWKNSWLDRLLVLASVAGISVSYLVVIIFAQWFLGYYYGLFPVWGWEGMANLGLPVIAGVACGLGGNVRFYRTVFVNELNKEYLRTAAAKGCPPLSVYAKHLLRNASIQIITRASAALPFLFTGSLLLESFFGIPGLGFAGIDALYNSDLQLLKALVVTSALLFLVMNLIADLAYAWADPRIRLK